MIEQASLIIGDGNWAVKSDSLLGYKLIDGKYYPRDMSVVRATTATRVNSAGLVELVPYNFAQYSQDFTNGVWGAAGYGNPATIVANDTIAPDGTMTASKATFTASGTQGRLVQSITTTNGAEYTASFYVKYGNKTTINFYSDAAVFGTFVTFNFTSNTITNSNNTYGSSVENVGNGWYRISFKTFAPSSTAQFGFITFGGEDGFCYIWGGQLESGATATAYQKTETRLNIPRLDYSNGTCPSLLVEPQRTNLVTYSSSFDNSDWVKQSGVSVTANQVISPDGTQNADLVTGNGTSGLFQANKSVSTTIANTKSVWLKGVSGGEVVVLQDPNQTNNTLNCNLTTNWQRFTLSEVQSTGGAGLWVTNIPSGGVYIWGAQLENAPYPTSYIPTTSASVTRNADVISKTGISSLIGQTEGTFFVDVNLDETSDFNGWFLKENATFDTFVFLQRETSGRIAAGYYGSGALQARIETAPNQPIGHYKIAFGYKNNDFVMYINGTQIGTDTSGSVSGLMDYIDVHWTQTGTNHQNAVALWKTRLTNTQLAQLTTI